MPSFRITSATDVPDSACRSANAMQSALPKSASFPSEKPTLSGDAKVQKPNIPDGPRNGEDVNGEIARYSFVTAEKSSKDEKTVIVSPVHPKDLSEFEGLLFQIDINEEEDVVILRQVQMFFWPWEDDEEFKEMDSPEDGPTIA